MKAVRAKDIEPTQLFTRLFIPDPMLGITWDVDDTARTDNLLRAVYLHYAATADNMIDRGLYMPMSTQMPLLGRAGRDAYCERVRGGTGRGDQRLP